MNAEQQLRGLSLSLLIAIETGNNAIAYRFWANIGELLGFDLLDAEPPISDIEDGFHCHACPCIKDKQESEKEESRSQEVPASTRDEDQDDPSAHPSQSEDRSCTNRRVRRLQKGTRLNGRG